MTPVGAALVVVVASSAVLAAWVGVRSWRRKDVPGAPQLALFAVAAAGWSGATALEYVTPWTDLAYVFYQVSNVSSLLASYLWLVFAVHYSGYGDRLTRRVQAVIWAAPTVYVLLVLTEPWHTLLPARNPTTFAGLQLFAPGMTTPMAIQSTLSYLVGLIGFGLVIHFAFRTSGGYRRQALTVVSSGLVVFVVSFAYLWLGLGTQDGLDPTPLSMAGMTAVIAFALFRQEFLSVRQLAPDRLFDELPDPVIVLDDADTVIEANRSGSGFVDSGDALSDTLPALAEGLADGDPTVTLSTPMDEQRTYDVTATPLFDPYERQQGRVVVLRDITARKRRERELERKNERLDQFAAIVSHDLRNPLNVADGYTQLALDRDSTDPLPEVQDALAQMDTMIDELLTVARTGTDVDPVWTEFEPIAADAWPFVDDGPTLSIEARGQLRADPDRLSLLLGNLYRNARDHGPADVSVRVGLTSEGFFVADDGPGIPEAERETVFERGVTTSEEGTGLGLTIVETVADAHGWTVDVSESDGGGARFDVVDASTRRLVGDAVRSDSVR